MGMEIQVEVGEEEVVVEVWRWGWDEMGMVETEVETEVWRWGWEWR